MKNLILLLTILLTSTIITSQTWSNKYKRVYKKSYKKIEKFLYKQGYQKSYNKFIIDYDQKHAIEGENLQHVLNNFVKNVIFTKKDVKIYIIEHYWEKLVDPMVYAEDFLQDHNCRRYHENFQFDWVNYKTILAGDNKISDEIFVLKGK